MTVLVNLYITFCHAFSGKAFFKMLLCDHNQFRIKQVKKTIIFGVVLGEHLSCKPPHFSICYKTSKSVAVSYRAGLFLPKPCFKTLYYCLVYPFFHYCIIVWVSTYKTNSCRLVSLQKRVVRIVSRDYRCSLRPYFQRIGVIKNLSDIDNLMFSLNHGHSLLPLRFKDYFSFHQEVSREKSNDSYDTKYADDFHLPFCTAYLRKFSVSFQGPIFSAL